MVNVAMSSVPISRISPTIAVESTPPLRSTPSGTSLISDRQRPICPAACCGAVGHQCLPGEHLLNSSEECAPTRNVSLEQKLGDSLPLDARPLSRQEQRR